MITLTTGDYYLFILHAFGCGLIVGVASVLFWIA